MNFAAIFSLLLRMPFLASRDPELSRTYRQEKHELWGGPIPYRVVGRKTLSRVVSVIAWLRQATSPLTWIW